jgi:hypothetical protein
MSGGPNGDPGSTVFSLHVPADDVQWGPLRAFGDRACSQTATLTLQGRTVLTVTVMWPGTEPGVPVVSEVHPRRAGAKD